jgi:hypothetical protein
MKPLHRGSPPGKGSEHAEKVTAEQGQSSTGLQSGGAGQQGAAVPASAVSSEALQGPVPGPASGTGRREGQSVSRPTSATLSHSNSGVFATNDSGYGSELGEGRANLQLGGINKWLHWECAL